MKAFGVLAAMVCCSTAALADWRNTRWGMSVDQVAALIGDATPVDRLIPVMGEPDVIARLRAGFASGEATTFYFREGKLARVEVEYGDARRCPRVLDELRAKYGAPIVVEKTYEVLTVFSWLDGRDDVVLRWLDSGSGTGMCSIVQRRAFG